MDLIIPGTAKLSRFCPAKLCNRFCPGKGKIMKTRNKPRKLDINLKLLSESNTLKGQHGRIIIHVAQSII